MQSQERYVVDAGGNRLAVVLAVEEYQQLLEAWEELDAIKVYDIAKAFDDEIVPFEQAIAEIERLRE